MNVRPSVGRIVLYRSRTGSYTVPAVITAVAESLNPAGVEAGHVPALTGDGHVHLTVFAPGRPGMRGGAGDFVSESAAAVRYREALARGLSDAEAREEGWPRSENVAGCYQEWDIPPALRNESNSACAAPVADDFPPGSWAWPERV